MLMEGRGGGGGGKLFLGRPPDDDDDGSRVTPLRMEFWRGSGTAVVATAEGGAVMMLPLGITLAWMGGAVKKHNVVQLIHESN